MAEKGEWLPWYRRKDYKGNLTEEEKRILDSFRMKEPHPAAKYGQLPEEVQSYIGRLEIELYDSKQDAAAGKAIALTGVAALLIWLAYKGYTYSSTLSYLSGLLVLVAAWVNYRWEWHKNANDLHPRERGAPISTTDEELRYEWELDYITHYKHRNEDAERD